MSVKLRFRRLGRRNRSFYRLGAIDTRSRRDGKVIEELGYYDPEASDDKHRLQINLDRIRYWLSVGAQPSDTLRGMLIKAGFPLEPVKRPTRPTRAEREAAEQAAKGEPAAS